jgi:DNA-binding SARP family transcriptional activator
VVLGGEAVTDFESDSARALLAYLATEPGRARSREMLAEMLWPERPPGAALSNLRHVLSVLRTALGERDPEPRFLIADRSNLSIAASPQLRVDLVEFERLAAAPAGTPGAVEAWEQAVELWRGPLLEGLQIRAGGEWEEWLVVSAERARRRFAGVLHSLSSEYERSGDWGRAISTVRRQIEVSPWDEQGHRQLMRLLASTGEGAQALSHFEHVSALFEAELDSAPSPATTALAELIREGDLQSVAAEEEVIFPEFLTVEGPAASPLFVGMDRELDALGSHVDRALEGDGHVLLVAGEAGCGKTMLAGELIARASDSPDLLAAQGRCNAYGGLGDPYLPFREVLGMLTGDVAAAYGAGVLKRDQAARLWESIPRSARLVHERGPSLVGVMVNGALLLGRAEKAVPEAPWLEQFRDRLNALQQRPPAAERMQPALFDEYTSVLEGLATAHPLLLVIDDLQWTDQGSAALLWHVSRRLEGRRILVVGLYRPEEIAAGHPLETVLREIRAGEPDSILELSGSRDFIDAFVDSEPNELDEEFREELFKLTGGHPLFTVEMVRGMQERAEIRRNQAGVWIPQETLDWEQLPRRVEAVIAQRIGRLPRDLQADLAVASVQGEEFVTEVIAEVREDSDVAKRLSLESTSPHRLTEASGAARVGKEVIARHRFRHILFQRYLYDRLDQGEQIRLHELTGRALESLYRGDPEPPVVDLAHHFDRAGLVEPAIAYLHQAGQRAVQMSANEAAIGLLQRARDLLEEIPESTERDELELGLLASLAAPIMSARGYGAPEAEDMGRRVRELCRRLEPSMTVVLALHGLAAFLTIRGRHLESEAVVGDIIPIVEELADPVLQAFVSFLAGYEQSWRGRLATGHDLLMHAYRDYGVETHGWLAHMAGQAGGPEALVWDGAFSVLRGYPEQMRHLVEDGIGLAQHLGHPPTICHTHAIGRGLTRIFAGEYQDALDNCDQMESLASTEHLPFWLIAAQIYRGTAIGHLGKPDEGIELIRQGIDTWHSMGADAFQGLWWGEIAEIEAEAGHPERGLEMIDRVLPVSREGGERLSEVKLLVHRGLLLSAMNDPSAGEALEQAIDEARSIDARLLELRATTGLATCLADRGEAAGVRERLADVYGCFTEGFESPYLVEARTALEQI